MTETALAKRLTEKYGEGGMSASQVYSEFRIRKAKLPAGLETITSPFGKRKRYACGSIARWIALGRIPEGVVIDPSKHTWV
jgi:hypothetical protein